MKMQVCPDCKALVPDVGGPTHEYLGASSGCWKIYGEVLAKEYSDPAYMEVHRLTVDAYAVQHPGLPESRAIQSVNIHLLALYLVLEKQCDFSFATQLMGKIIERKKGEFIWLDPPQTPYSVTVVDVVKANSPQEHKAIVEKWAEATWQAWQSHHATIESMAKEIL